VPSGPRPPWRWRCGWRCGKAGGAKADQAERDAERADRDAAQARLVTVEPTYPETGYCQEIFIVVKVLNGSTLPILDVKLVDLCSDGAPDHTWRFDDSGPMGDVFKIEARVLAAGESFHLPVAYVNRSGRSAVLTSEDHVTIGGAAGTTRRRSA
jgi:hypothetical protein